VPVVLRACRRSYGCQLDRLLRRLKRAMTDQQPAQAKLVKSPIIFEQL